ncbi:tetratricopeptide repeat protein [Salinisphaera sp. Q1T1-3]|uniref:tetratricopeptide repeat protein n=1 Tax=Salinisphaera sp. Q1T1-3 TaxID=2321229 RepID=UPI000E70DB4B|nr:tetratricopeptide repeat protein [Salinisphaera sp. Q1T1-3]RJS95051.1 hypothetical protein D3260_00380 [Salinisphaera sp. Q1T1-3]
MKRLSLLIASGLVLAGCASAPPEQRGSQRPMPDQGPPGQTQRLPSQQQPNYDQDNAATDSQTAGPGSTGNTGQQPQTQPEPTPPKSAAQVSSPAVMSLIKRADTLANGGHMEDAAATLERALDLDPRNPFIYQRLAAVRLSEGQAGQAEQLAMKSNSVAGSNPFVAAGNWQLIAEARKSTGDSKGASEARSRAVGYRQSASQYGQ